VRLRAIDTSLLSNTVPSPSFCLAMDLPVIFSGAVKALDIQALSRSGTTRTGVEI
jgi:hypothetical protein